MWTVVEKEWEVGDVPGTPPVRGEWTTLFLGKFFPTCDGWGGTGGGEGPGMKAGAG